jgi:hypothetical protein
MVSVYQFHIHTVQEQGLAEGHTPSIAYFVLLPDGGDTTTFQNVLLKPQMTMGFKLQIMPRTNGFSIYITLKCDHKRTLRGRNWMINQQRCRKNVAYMCHFNKYINANWSFFVN